MTWRAKVLIGFELRVEVSRALEHAYEFRGLDLLAYESDLEQLELGQLYEKKLGPSDVIE